MAQQARTLEAAQQQDLGFTAEPLPASHHVCLLYDSEEEQQRVVCAFLRAGIDRREFVSYHADTTSSERFRAWMRDGGVDVAQAEQRAAFRFVEARAAYCPDGSFDPDGLISRLMSRYAACEKAGHTGSRLAGEMTWVLRGWPGSERFLEAEACINTIDTAFPHVGMCLYDTRRFDGATIYRVLQVHPFMVAGGQIVRNPCYGGATHPKAPG